MIRFLMKNSKNRTIFADNSENRTIFAPKRAKTERF
ncbi:hypothetical protein T06_4433 [Trichinella sp. T6]|nr:hypothetical protein T06_4433 [Trichinella sp. T6]